MALKRSRVRIPLGPLVDFVDYAECDVELRSSPSVQWIGAFLFVGSVLMRRKGHTVAANKEKRNLVKDVAAGLRGLIADLDRLLNPPPPLKPVRVPVPVRPPRPRNGYYR